MNHSTHPPSTSSFPLPPPINSEWEQVQQFPTECSSNDDDDDDDDDWTEEVEYLTFDFGHSFAPDPITSYSSLQVLGLNTDTPFAKIGNQIYRGAYESLIGTELIMNRSTDEENPEVEQQSQAVFEPLATTKSRIRWIPVKLIESDQQVSENESSSPEDLNGADPKLKKKASGGGGGRHWASHWTRFVPRAPRQLNQAVIAPVESNKT